MTKRQPPNGAQYLNLTIPALYELAITGQAAAENSLLSAIRPKLRKYIQKLIWEHDLLEDVLQEALLACLIKVRAHAVKKSNMFMPYAYGIARNMANQQIKKLKHPAQPISIDDEIAEPIVIGNLNQAPDALIAQQQMETFVQNGIQQLPQARDQQVLNSYYFDEEESDTICNQINVNTDHLYRVLCRARQRLGKLIASKAPEHKAYLLH